MTIHFTPITIGFAKGLFTHEGTDYTLEFTRKSIESLERRGFVADDLTKRPMTSIPKLFAGAFLAHHKFIKKETVDEIFASLGDKRELIGALAEMYSDPILDLIEGQEESAGNATWGKDW